MDPTLERCLALVRKSLSAGIYGWVVFSAIYGCGPGDMEERSSPEEAAAGEVPASERGTATELQTAVDDLLAPLVENDLLSGSLLMAREGRVVLAREFGLADREHAVPNTEITPFRLASVSKSITAVAVLQLVEEGSLALDATLESHVPGFIHGDLITIEHLLSHRSGIPSDVYLPDFREKSLQSLSLDEAVTWIREQAEPRFMPGERFEYSNSGYLLLSAIIEKVSGLSFQQYLAEKIFEPAGMSRSGLDSAERILPHRARGYSRTEAGEVSNAPYRNPTFGWGYGALYSTTGDLLRFTRALAEGRLLSDESRRLMWTPRSETPWGNRYGLGWFIDEHDEKEMVVALGSTGGFVATLRYFPAEDTTIVMLLNHDFLLYDQLFDQLSSILFSRPWEPFFKQVSGPELQELSQLAGIYEMDDGTLLELRATKEGLEFGKAGSESLFTAYPTSKASVYVPAQNSRLRFRETESGEIELLALFGNLAWRGQRTKD